MAVSFQVLPYLHIYNFVIPLYNICKPHDMAKQPNIIYYKELWRGLLTNLDMTL